MFVRFMRATVADVEGLRAHLARCAACRVSLTLPDELHAEAAVAAQDLESEEALLAKMVRGAMLTEPRRALS